MSIWATLFSAKDTVEDITGAVINTGDKLFYTDEEKMDDRKEMRKHFTELLKAYEPFRVAQRVLAFMFTGSFLSAFLTAVFMGIYNIIYTYKQLKAGIKKEDVITLDTQPLLDTIVAFDMGWIMMAIVSFYFLGGTFASFKKGR